MTIKRIWDAKHAVTRSEIATDRAAPFVAQFSTTYLTFIENRVSDG